MGIYGERMGRYLRPPDDHQWACDRASVMSRLGRWRAKGAARVIHPVRGTVVVPCASPLSALLCAAEIWGCDWLEIRDAGVWLAEPGDRAETMPESSKRRSTTC